jgi:hypothetical protein
MKRRTEITTETREVWVIREGGVTQYKDVQPQSGDVGKVDSNEALVPADGGDDSAPSGRQPNQGGTSDH